MDSRQKRCNELDVRLNAYMMALKDLDPNSREYGQILSSIIKGHINLSGKLARTFRLYLEYNEHASYFFQAVIKAIPKFDPEKGNASNIILEIAKGDILNANRQKLRDLRRNRQAVVQYIRDISKDSLCCDIDGNVCEVMYYDGRSD